MIVGKAKPIAFLAEQVRPYRRVAVIGCQSCMAVCLAGGDKETRVLAKALELERRVSGGSELAALPMAVKRQCELEYLEPLKSSLEGVEAIISLGCGVGVQYLVAAFPELWVVPGLDTLLVGGPVALGVWEEYCRLCGECILYLTGGICPVARCAKGLLNGPCGGAVEGRCEVNPELPCAWVLIYQRLQRFGRLDLLRQLLPPKNWQLASGCGPKKLVRQEVKE
ncbi:methylenetetrahydrofolate reductase C-terminal domain-containing protein [Desulfothermobacter acidiphilus]|uniref:methylenetetrahydrofolate reductase C-terminal domain-containing protein n=1 Tax=Desulfothermobacter acidiphilus TaxID=1938353 RepID=UPI003F88972F